VFIDEEHIHFDAVEQPARDTPRRSKSALQELA
jgi:hypothetical protein